MPHHLEEKELSKINKILKPLKQYGIKMPVNVSLSIFQMKCLMMLDYLNRLRS